MEEARLTVQANELKLARKEHSMDQQLTSLKEELSKKISENTRRISILSSMNGENYSLYQRLGEAQAMTRPDESEKRQIKDREERHRMRSHVEEQQNEIQLLKVSSSFINFISLIDKILPKIVCRLGSGFSGLRVD